MKIIFPPLFFVILLYPIFSIAKRELYQIYSYLGNLIINIISHLIDFPVKMVKYSTEQIFQLFSYLSCFL